MGLLWSLKPVPGSKPGLRWVRCACDPTHSNIHPVSDLTASLALRMRKKNVQTPMVVTISVFKGHHTEAFMDQVPLASWVVERWYMAPGVRRIPITEQQLTGTLFLPPGTFRETTGTSRAALGSEGYFFRRFGRTFNPCFLFSTKMAFTSAALDCLA